MPDVAHSSWTARDGAPTDITALAQTSDGYLWLGTSLGLHRFDGKKFTNFPMSEADPVLVGSSITALAADTRGGLWIGDAHGGLTYLIERTATLYPLPHPIEHVRVNNLTVIDGALWMLAGDMICRWDGRAWEMFSEKHGLPVADYFTIFQDRSGNLWTASRHHAYELAKHEAMFREVGKGVFSVTQFFQTKDGAIWVSDGWRAVRPLLSDCTASKVPLRGTAAVQFDNTGHLWLAQDSTGVTRLSGVGSKCEASHAEGFDVRDGLSASVTRGILKDRDGTIWVATELGLDRFRSRAFLTVLHGRFKFYPALALGVDGTVWAEGHGMPLQHMSEHGAVPVGPPGKRFGSSPVAVDAKGNAWLLDPWDHHLHRIEQSTGRDQSIAVPAELSEQAAQHIAATSSGAILINFEGAGLRLYEKNSWRSFAPSGMPVGLPTALQTFGAIVLVGYADSNLYEHTASEDRLYSPQDGLNVGMVLAMTMSRNGTLWASGSGGIAWRDGSRFIPLRTSVPTLTLGTSGIAFDGDGDLWCNSGAGVVRIAARELESARNDHNYKVKGTSFHDADGIVGTPAQEKPLPTMLADARGQIWIAESGHIFQLAPSLLKRTVSPPQVAIEAVRIDGRDVPFGTRDSGTVRLRGGRDYKLEIDYAGIDLNTPAQVSYRYKLDGFETHWQAAEQGRLAVYAGLGPGVYNFRVAATNDGEHWVELAKALSLTVIPAFYQTTWFVSACVLLVFLLLWTLYLLRVRYVTARIRDRLEQRTNERLRIARELHDTLLQSIHGLMLRFHYATEQMEHEHPARSMLMVALQRADALIVEGRGRVQNLRGEGLASQSLLEILEATARELQLEDSPGIRIEEEGVRRKLHTIVREEICNIARECLLNAIQHSGASSIEIELSYGTTAFEFRCRDNGKGIDEMVLQAGGRSGHWGLRGMQERATQIGATTNIWSRSGRGTEIQIRVGAASAYVDRIRFLQRILGDPRKSTA